MRKAMKTVGLVVVLAAGVLLADEPPPRHLHWKSVMTGMGIPEGLTSETWVKGEKVRTVMQTPMGESTVVVKDKVVYMRTGAMAMKMPVEQGQAGKGPMPKPQDYATRLEEILKGGTRVGTEVIDGEKCDKWVIRPEGQKGEETLWISPSLKFPRQISVKTEAGEIIVKNQGIEKKVDLPDSAFEPDPKVNYQDMSGMRHGGPPPAAKPMDKPMDKPADKPKESPKK
jgi:outer membrane lipoprotein-sorting protein